METPVAFLLENLKQVVVYHANLIASAKDELEQLQNDLDILKAILKDASTRQKDEEVFKVWTKQIRDVVYQVEDTIDSCITHKMSKRIFSTSHISLAEQVKSLREGAVKNMLNMTNTNFANLPKAEPVQESTVEPTDQWRKDFRKDHIVGLEDEAKKVIGYLNEESDKLDVISIIGMPGLGKTTLAWKVYQDPEIQYQFPLRIWITVSAELNIKNVLLNILESFTKQINKYSNSSAEELTKVVKEYLTNGKFLIIMDDVWSPGAWDEIKKGLPLNNGTCKVLITTRHSNVASNANATRLPHELRFLNGKESWELLQYEVYGNLLKAEDYTELHNIGITIANNCDGLPLSIIVIAGILKDKIASSRGSISLQREEWEKISRSVPAYLANEDKLGRMSKIIALSYTKLPFELRDCFFYLGMFPEDAETSAKELILLWIAEGFIQEKPHKSSLEEIALDNLNELISRNLVMVEKTRANGEVKTFRVHDSIREFCKTQATEQNLYQEIKKGDEVSENVTKCRRLCIHSHVHNLFTRNLKIPAARSFLCFPKESVNLENKDISSATNAFSLLRVFDAEKIKFPKFPAKFITQLIHLRYLSLSCDLKLLPETITQLCNLQTLIVGTTSRTLEIKADIWKMSRLRHLKTKASIILTAKGGKGQKSDNLKTLGSLSPESCTESVFTKAKNLHTLGVRGDLTKILEPNSLRKLEHLNELKLEHDAYPLVTAENPLNSLPDWHSFPTKLRILSLKCTYLNWEEMSIVRNLETLEVLKLKDHAFSEENNSWKVNEGGFLNLEYLHIERMDLTFWSVLSEKSFPKLRSLKIKNCERLNGIPKQLGKNLEMLYLERVTQYAVKSAMDIQSQKKQDGTARKFKLAIAPADIILNYSLVQ